MKAELTVLLRLIGQISWYWRRWRQLLTLVLENFMNVHGSVLVSRVSHGGYLRDSQPVVGLLHGLASVVHWFGLVPLVPVRTQTCRQHWT